MAKARFNIAGKSGRESIRIVGNVRQTQLITTFGIGATVDFVHDTVIVAGTDDWDTGNNAGNVESRKIFNENLQSIAGVEFFLEPKASGSSGWVKPKDIPAFVFPEMLYCPKCKRLVTAKEALNATPKKPNRCCLSRPDGAQCTGTLIASRFIVVCENGHLEDFPYDWWIHGDAGCQAGRAARFSMYNISDRSDIDSLFVKCDICGKQRGMSSAFAPAAFGGDHGYSCKGNHPHLKEKKAKNEPDCEMQLKTRLRSSSSVYYPVTASALLIPPWSREAVIIVERLFDALQYMPDPKQYLQTKTTPTTTVSQLLDAYAIIKARKGTAAPRSEREIYIDEYRVLSEGASENEPGDYSAYVADVPVGFEKHIEQITIVDRLTVTETLMGFTRLKPWGGEYSDNGEGTRRLAPLSAIRKTWLPATQLRGEGIFIRFRQGMLKKWVKRVHGRYSKMEHHLSLSFLRSRTDRFSPEYVLMHTFSHLLIRQLANECGYSAASIKEKIYSTFTSPSSKNEKMSGVLIYLASSDCDGSLGGLVSIAQNPERLRIILENMLIKAAWCSGDPLCITSTEQGFDALNYSACHDCMLLPETSCEFRNVLLDRVSLVGTPDAPQLGFMGSILNNYEEINEDWQDESIEDEPNITITETRHQLFGDYTDWTDASALFDDHVIQVMTLNNAPLAESYEVELLIDSHPVHALLLWETQKVIVYEELSMDDAAVLEVHGWTCLDANNLTAEGISEAFGGTQSG